MSRHHPRIEPDLSRRAFLVAAPATALTVALVGCSSSSSGGAKQVAATTSVPKGSHSVSKGSQWPFYGHDLFQTRTNVAERKITRSTVSELETVWHIDDLVGVVGTPAVVDGVAYFADYQGGAHAVDVETGKKIWSQQVGGQFVAAPAVHGKRAYFAEGKTLV